MVFSKKTVLLLILLFPDFAISDGRWLINPVDRGKGSPYKNKKEYISYISPQKKEDFIHWIKNIPDHGIEISENIIHLLNSNPSEDWLEEIASVYAAYIDQGYISRKKYQPEWQIFDELLPKDMAFDSTILNKIEPLIPEYALFKKGLMVLRQWTFSVEELFPKGIVLEKGIRHEAVRYLNQWLYDLGFSDIPVSEVFGQDMENAIKHVQYHGGISVDGVFSDKTKHVLKEKTAQRINALKINMERMRWLPRLLPVPHLRVDIAGFNVAWVMGNGGEVRYRAVVGKPEQPTPIFRDTIDSITINPVWTVPHAEASTRLLMAEQSSPGYLTNYRFHVFESWLKGAPQIDSKEVDWKRLTAENFPFKLKQQPGSQNHFGLYTFDSNNRYNVFLHDTNQPALFSRPVRALTQGGALVENIAELAYEIGKHQRMYSLMESSTHSKKTTTFELARELPVFYVYFTVWPDPSGRLAYRDDIYQLDTALLKRIEKP